MSNIQSFSLCSALATLVVPALVMPANAGMEAETSIITGTRVAPPQDIVYLNNGDRISGRVIHRGERGEILFEMAAGPVITISESMLGELQIGAAESPEGQTRAQADSQVDVPAVDQTLDAQMADRIAAGLSALEPAAPPDEVPFSWSGRIELGGKVQTGNSDTQSIVIDTQIKAKEGKNRYAADFQYLRSEEEDIVTDDTKELLLDFRHFRTQKWFVGADLDFVNDKVAGLDLRTSVGGKTGYQFYERDDLNLLVSGGLAYLREELENGDTNTSLALTQETDYEQAFYENKLRLFYEHDFLVPTNETNAYIFNAETGVRVPLAAKFIGTASIDLDYDNDPAPGADKEDFTYSLKLGYEF